MTRRSIKVIKISRYPLAPLVLALVLGPLVERSLYRTMTLNHGDFFVIFTRPISGTLMTCVALVLLGPLLIGARRAWRQSRSDSAKRAAGHTDEIE